MSNQLVFTIKDIDDQIISYLYPQDLLKLGIINKYYNNLVNNFVLIIPIPIKN